jgi:pimeloyl-ACP methyl ester carboxylesterase
LSDKPEISYTINQLSGFLRDFIISFSSGKIYLAGHSLGGAICLNLVIQTPNLVERLVLVNSVFEKIPFSIRLGTFRFIPRLVKKVPQWMVESSSRKSIHKKELITSELNDRAYQYINTPGNLEAMFSIMQSNINLSGLDINYLSQYKEGMKDINIPVLILYGDQDKIIPDINSKLLHRYLSNSECISVKNCGHGLHYESYEAFCKEVLTFFKIHLSP